MILKMQNKKLKTLVKHFFLKQINKNIENNRLFTLLFLAIRLDKVGKTNVCNFEEFRKVPIQS